MALAPWVKTIAYCEQDRYCQALLLSRQASGELPIAPIWDDVRTLQSDLLPRIDIIFGGFPCQDISVAGNGAGLGGERSGLFFEIARLVSEIRPSFVFLENVPAIRTRGADAVVGRLAELGYDCRWGVLSAFDVGAPHLRERWWLLAHRRRCEVEPQRDRQGQARPWSLRSDTDGLCHTLSDPERLDLRNEQRRRGWQSGPGQAEPRDDGEAQPLANSYRAGLEERKPRNSSQQQTALGGSWWATEPNMGRVAHGIPKRVDRLRALGNAVVPIQAREAFRRLSGL